VAVCSPAGSAAPASAITPPPFPPLPIQVTDWHAQPESSSETTSPLPLHAIEGLQESSCDRQQEALAVEGTPATASASDTASAEQPLLQHVDGKTERVTHEQGSTPCVGTALQDEGDGMGLLCEVVVEASNPGDDVVQDRCRKANDASVLLCFVLRWPVRLIWGAFKAAKTVFRAILRL
jgi:hypothetical protein